MISGKLKLEKQTERSWRNMCKNLWWQKRGRKIKRSANNIKGIDRTGRDIYYPHYRSNISS